MALRKFANELQIPEPAGAPVPQVDIPENIPPAEIFKRRAVRRKELHRLVPLSETTIYELEQKGEFPRRFYLSPRCVVWPLAEVLQWIDARRADGRKAAAPPPDYRLRPPRKSS